MPLRRNRRMMTTVRKFTQTAAWLMVTAMALATNAPPPAPSVPAPAATTVDREINFQPVQEAIADGATQEKVTAIYFTAKWCGWCRKMSGTTFEDPSVTELADRFTWAKVDIDEQPQVAARFGVTGVPLVVFLNRKGEPIHSRAGYISPPAMVKLINQFASQSATESAHRQRQKEIARTTVGLKSAADPQALSKAVMEAVGVLASAQRSGRRETKQALLAAGSGAWPGLVTCLSDERLAVRAAAFDLLIDSAHPPLSFDPFAPKSDRDRQVAKWRRWIDAETNRDPMAAEPQLN